MMRAFERSRGGLAALALIMVMAALAATPVRAQPSLSQPSLSQPTVDERPLTPEEEAAIRNEMAALHAVLVQGGKAPHEAKLAVNAVGVCFGAAYMHGLTREQATAVCGEVLDAFTIQPGSILYQLTAADRAWIESRVTDWTSELAAILDADELGAVRSTMTACLEGNMRRGETREGAVKRCALGLLPLLNRPGLREFVVNAAESR